MAKDVSKIKQAEVIEETNLDNLTEDQTTTKAVDEQKPVLKEDGGILEKMLVYRPIIVKGVSTTIKALAFGAAGYLIGKAVESVFSVDHSDEEDLIIDQDMGDFE